jgi:hypothetical protein
MSSIQYTPYDDANNVLDVLFIGVKDILGDQFIGMYLYGSLASGDFEPKSSDIDFVVVTEGILPYETISKLEAMHKQIWSSGLKWASKLEGSYIPKGLIRKHDPDGPPCPTVNEGSFFVDRRGSDWIIQRHIIREYGVVLEGPDPKSLIDPVSPDEIRQSVLGVLDECWFPMLEDPSWPQKHDGNYHGYTVITMCRALHALQHGMIVSKPVAIRWAREKLGAHWHTLIEQAVASQDGQRPEILKETLQFIRFTKEEIEGSDHAQDSS